MTQVLQYPTTPRRSLAAAAEVTDEEIRERHRRHIAEISKYLAPPQSEDLNYEQEQWLRRRMRSPMGQPWKSWSKREAVE